MKVVLSRRARAELIAQIDWLEERSPSAALQAADAIRTALKTLGAFPRVGRILEDNQRS